jgi:hypothetical protein
MIRPSEAWYGMAECYALRKDAARAVECLVHAGSLKQLKEKLTRDSDFDAIREEESFRSLLASPIA